MPVTLHVITIKCQTRKDSDKSRFMQIGWSVRPQYQQCKADQQQAQVDEFWAYVLFV